ncbi:MerR family transcriptional regulator [Roseateles saccharophilus]|jgi:DNA-binding transcriptional MerR regulator|uniref:DNA-binding transcriptional MerR regulator n=1 Tax=Roseateles saccharophilus TaxID=304 RepID=A0A4R3UUP5_ROSSA|nr:MerR family transcriptional regulator [Roseateles saccharophilus]MDG0833163.1 MerR family transcriptional regulator [Roseateles saccharophilus]TCU94630.1 DNA-binding transcriptional MerR regulator [Roseateles saccharophilus]
MKLNECARMAGITADTLRHYLRLGLIEPQARTANGYRRFGDDALARVRFIRSAVGLGFKLGDVAELLSMSEQGHLPCPRARELLSERIARHRQELDAMADLYMRMQRALHEWQQMPDGAPDGTLVCGLIEGVAADMPPDRARRAAAPRR